MEPILIHPILLGALIGLSIHPAITFLTAIVSIIGGVLFQEQS